MRAQDDTCTSRTATTTSERRQPLHHQPARGRRRIHQHNEIGNGDIDWEELFGALREVEFDGIATVCVFGWEENADDIHRRMLERVTAELAGLTAREQEHGRSPGPTVQPTVFSSVS